MSQGALRCSQTCDGSGHAQFAVTRSVHSSRREGDASTDGSRTSLVPMLDKNASPGAQPHSCRVSALFKIEAAGLFGTV
eukprot:6930504-Alexandrium_andersonii.AAC.1